MLSLIFCIKNVRKITSKEFNCKSLQQLTAGSYFNNSSAVSDLKNNTVTWKFQSWKHLCYNTFSMYIDQFLYTCFVGAFCHPTHILCDCFFEDVKGIGLILIVISWDLDSVVVNLLQKTFSFFEYIIIWVYFALISFLLTYEFCFSFPLSSFINWQMVLMWFTTATSLRLLADSPDV